MTDSTDGSFLLDTFLELVQIESPSRREARCAKRCAEILESLGCSVRFDDSRGQTGSDTGNLIAELPGTVDGVLVLSAHMDTVEPSAGIEPIVHEGLVVSAGETILGADDKAGIAAAMECIRTFAASGEHRPTIRCVFTVGEEIGLVGAKALKPEDVAGDLCLVLDADGLPGGIVVAAPTHFTFTATFTGRAAHAGVAPEKGISAIAMAADAIAALPIGRLDEETTANVGTVNGGTATNVIAASVRVTGECRSLERARADALREEMDATMRQAALRHGGSAEVEWTLEYEGFKFSETHPAVKLIEDACRDINIAPSTIRTGGGSDANIISAMGVPTVALACGMQGVHSTSEQISVADLTALARLCESVARRMASTAG